MDDIRTPIPVQEAIQRVMQYAVPLDTERVSLAEAYGRILAEPIIARHDVPSFNRAPYDGYAVRSVDTIGASGTSRVSFRVVDHIGAGQLAGTAIGEGEAVRIMTGALLPEGADAVVMLEQVIESDQTFTIRKSFMPYENVSLQGEESRKGDLLIPSGTYIQPGTVALLATFGYTEVQAGRRPKAAILCTGSELLDIHDELEPGKVRNSNGFMIAAQLARIGITSHSCRVIADDLDSCCEAVKIALQENDCLITTGGVSVGDFDYLPAIYERLGAKVLFNKVAMRPGSVTTVAVLDGKLLFGLSGNPSACFIGFELFARPALLKMMGSNKPFLSYARAILAEDMSKANPFIRFVGAEYIERPTGATITSAGINKSNAVSSIAKGNAIMVLPGGTRGFSAGSIVDVLLLGVEEGNAEWMI